MTQEHVNQIVEAISNQDIIWNIPSEVFYTILGAILSIGTTLLVDWGKERKEKKLKKENIYSLSKAIESDLDTLEEVIDLIENENSQLVVFVPSLIFDKMETKINELDNLLMSNWEMYKELNELRTEFATQNNLLEIKKKTEKLIMKDREMDMLSEAIITMKEIINKFIENK